MYLPGQNFTGLGSKLDKRLNSNGTPKVWSKLVNRVDGVAYRHNLAYAKYSNTAKRIVACAVERDVSCVPLVLWFDSSRGLGKARPPT